MNDERFGPLWYSTDLTNSHTGPEAARHRATGLYTEPATDPADPPFPPWDPAEELAYLLQEAHNEQYGVTLPHPRLEVPVATPPPVGPLHGLKDITEELPPVRTAAAPAPRGHRKHTVRRRPDATRVASCVIAALAALTVSMVSLFSGVATYEPLLLVTAAHGPGGPAPWWPLLVYGPWTAGSLSVLRAALHQRRAPHSWFVVLLFSTVAVLLCVAQAPRTVPDTAVAALPGIAALACFQQLVRQITLTRPPLRPLPRHRHRCPEHPAPHPHAHRPGHHPG
ncbi:MAG TPA: hypothetical protein VFP69_12885 [Streptomyces sp.]|nr:hypothetical protein [Streptomyces sp.]